MYIILLILLMLVPTSAFAYDRIGVPMYELPIICYTDTPNMWEAYLFWTDYVPYFLIIEQKYNPHCNIFINPMKSMNYAGTSTCINGKCQIYFDPNTYNTERIIIHELGHVFGLGHINFPHTCDVSVMYFANCNHKPTLDPLGERILDCFYRDGYNRDIDRTLCVALFR